MKIQVPGREELLSRITKHVILNASLLDEFGVAKWKIRSKINLILG